MNQISERLVLAFDTEQEQKTEEMKRLEAGYTILSRGRDEFKNQYFLIVFKGEMIEDSTVIADYIGE